MRFARTAYDALTPVHGRKAGEPCGGHKGRSGQAADFRQVIVDTTVEEKAVTFPTDAKLMHRAGERLGEAQKYGLALRQSCAGVGKFALINHQRYAHAKQFGRNVHPP